MGRNNNKKYEETLNIRMPTDLLKRLQAAKAPSGWEYEADSSFARFLLILGLDELEWINKEKAERREETPVKKGKTARTADTEGTMRTGTEG